MTVLPLPRRPLAGLLVAWCALSLAGCNFIHNYGSGTHLDAARDKPKNPNAAKASTMQAEVVTDANGDVETVRMIRSSGSNAVDNFFASSIRENRPIAPSTRAVVEINYNPGGGFTNPKVLSAVPAS